MNINWHQYLDEIEKQLIHFLMISASRSTNFTIGAASRFASPAFGYSWIERPIQADEKLICRPTRRATALLRPLLESSWRGEFRPSGFHFL